MTAKAMTLRLDAETADALQLVAAVFGTTVSDEVRQAIASYLKVRSENLNPCQSRQRAYLAVPDPNGAELSCSRRAGHDGRHRFLIEWTDD